MATSAENVTLSDILTHLKSFDARFNALEEKLGKSIEANNLRLEKIELEVAGNTSRVAELETSVQFLADEYEKNKSLLAVKDAQINALKSSLDSLHNQTKQDRLSQNEQNQHYRSDHYCKISGIATQPGEVAVKDSKEISNAASLEVIKNIVKKSGIIGFNANQVDVCHRLGDDIFSPIIVKFTNKSDRGRFYKQKKKFYGMTTESVGYPLKSEQVAILKSGDSVTKLSKSSRGRGAAAVGSTRGNVRSNRYIKDNGEVKLPYVTIYEHLTKLNQDLLTKARSAAFQAGFRYKGYTVQGEVRVKLSDGAGHIAVKDYPDIDKIR